MKKMVYKRKYWTVKEDNKLRKLSGTMSFVKMKQLFNERTEDALQQRSGKLGLLAGNVGKRKYFHNEAFWSVPDPINCYWAGFVACDGHLGMNKNKYFTLEIALSRQDKNHLEKFKEDVEFTGFVKDYERKGRKDPNKINYGSRARINCGEQWANDLKNNFGIPYGDKGTRFDPPNFNNEDLIWCYIIGLLDGDGSLLVIPEKRTKNRNKINLSFVSSNNTILNWFMSILTKHFNAYCSIKTPKIGNYRSFTLSHYKSLEIIDYLKGFPVPKLDRKWKSPELLEELGKAKKSGKMGRNFQRKASCEKVNLLNTISHPESLCVIANDSPK